MNNALFPFYLHGINADTGAPDSIRLIDGDLPTVIRQEPPQTSFRAGADRRSTDPTENRYDSGKDYDSQRTRDLQDLVEATGDPLLGILVKIHTRRGMSSQLIMRWDQKARGEINELLPGERAYEEERHALHVYYQTEHYCALAPEIRARALEGMRRLAAIPGESDRQRVAETHPLFGLKRKLDPFR